MALATVSVPIRRERALALVHITESRSGSGMYLGGLHAEFSKVKKKVCLYKHFIKPLSVALNPM